jgi:Domain of unknown function (DUF4157)
MLQRKCACGVGSSGFTGRCSECDKKKLLGNSLQAKLRVNEPGDEYEQEAERVARDVMRTLDARPEGGSAETMSRSLVQRRVAGDDNGQGEVPAVANDVLLSPGETLDGPTRAFFEARFGYDFGKVRIHADAKAAQSASDLNALAYTVGNNVVFGAERFQPATSQGRSLLAHELTHVVQQTSASGAAGALQRSPLFPDESCDKERVKDKITAAVEQSLGMVQQAIAALAEPEGVARPLKRFFSIEPNDPIALFLINENLRKLERKLAGAVDSYCQTPADYRSENHKAPPRGYAGLDPKTRRPTPDSPITYNRNIFRLTGTTTHRQVVNTVLHEYAHLAGIGHAEPVQGSPIGDENSTKVRGLTTEQAINSAETMMRFVRAVSARGDSGAVKQAASAISARDQQGQADESSAAGDTGDALNCHSLDQLMPPGFPKAEIEERPTLEAHYPGLKGNCFRLLRGGDDSCFGYCLHRAAGGDPLGKGVNLPIPATIEEFERSFASYYEPIALEAVDAANPPADAELALFARGDTPAHTACRSDIQYEGQYLWESKVSPVYPLILHHLSDLEGGAAGAVVKLYKRRAVEQP